MTLRDEQSPFNVSSGEPEGKWGSVGALLVVALIMIVVVMILDAARSQTRIGNEFSLSDNRRTMLMAPLPR